MDNRWMRGKSKMLSDSSTTSRKDSGVQNVFWRIFCDESCRTARSVGSKRKKGYHIRVNLRRPSGIINTSSFVALTCTLIILFTTHTTPTQGEILQGRPEEESSWIQNELIQSIRNELTEAEVRSIFGSPNQNKVPNFDIITPEVFHRKARGKRSTTSSSSSPSSADPSTLSGHQSDEDSFSRSNENHLPEKFIQINGLGRKFDLTVRPNLRLLDPDFVHLFRHQNRSEILPEDHVRKQLHCFYQGTAQTYKDGQKKNATDLFGTPRDSSNSTIEITDDEIKNILTGPVALSVCGGLQGIILSSDGKSEQEHYVIHPVPDRLHANGKLSNKNHHFLWKRDNGHTHVNRHENSMSGGEANPSSTNVDSSKNSYLNDDSVHSTCFHDLGNRYSSNNNKFHNQHNNYVSHSDENTIVHEQPPINPSPHFIKKNFRQHHHRRKRRNAQEYPYLPLSIAPDSYWLQHRSTLSPRSTAWKYRSTERATYNQRGEEDDEYDTSSSNADYNWQKGILVYESSTSSETDPSAARNLPFYTSAASSLSSVSTFPDNKKREIDPPRPRSSADWFDNQPESSLSYRPQTAYNTHNYTIPVSNANNNNKFFRKGRREDTFFGEDWKSSLDSDLNWSEKKEKATRSEFSNENLDSNPNINTIKEGPLSTLTIETAVFVDKDLYKHMQSNFPEDTQGEVIRIVLAMINAVQLLYQDPSLGHRVDFVLKRLEVLDSDPPGLLRPYDIDRFLTNFCKWQKTENPASDADPLHWDHALILTGLDLYVVHKSGKISNQVVGLAPVAGMCTRSSSCTVNEGRHFESVYVVAHEIGHNLGMRHDGPQAENECDPSSHIMSPTLGSGKITWSACSKKYLDMFMDTSQSKCLLDRARSESRLDHDADGRLPGERFDADRQCVLKYGRGSYHATQQPLEDVCRDLHCRREHYTWTSHPALEGTYCGLEMWCRAGKCVHRKSTPISAFEQNSSFKDFNGINQVAGSETAAYSSPKALDGGWGKWSLFTDCSSACLHSDDGGITTGSTGIRLAARRCDSPRPENGGIQCSGPDRRYKTCSTNKICSVGGPRTTVSQYANEVCSRAASVDNELTGRGFMTNTNDPERACSVWCETSDKGGSRSRGWSFPDGTACKMISQGNSASHFCVAGKCQDFSCNSYTYFGLSDEECSFTSTNEVTPRSWFGSASTNPSVNTVSNYRSAKAGWSTWETQSDCKLACLAPAKGLQLVKRHCSTGDSLCSGLALSVKLCKPDKATIQMNGCSRLQTPFEYATKVCSKYSDKITGLSGIGMQLSPTKEDPDRPCRIGCQDAGVPYRFYMVNGEEGWFPAGTDCSRGDPKKKAYCLGGKCIDFGNDDTPIYRINSKLLGKLEALFQRTKRQAVYNIMEPLHAPTALDQSSLKDLVHQFSMKTGNYPSINSRAGPDIFPQNQYIRNGLVPYPTEEAHLLPYSRSSNSHSISHNSNARSFDIMANTNNKNFHRSDKFHNKGRSFDTHFVDVDNGDWSSASDEKYSRFSAPSGTGKSQPIEGSFYEWRKMVSDCSVSCGSGIQELIVECVSGDTVVTDSLCSGLRRPGHSGYANCEKPHCEENRMPKVAEGSAIWNWLQTLLPPKNSTHKNV